MLSLSLGRSSLIQSRAFSVNQYFPVRGSTSLPIEWRTPRTDKGRCIASRMAAWSANSGSLVLQLTVIVGAGEPAKIAAIADAVAGQEKAASASAVGLPLK